MEFFVSKLSISILLLLRAYKYYLLTGKLMSKANRQIFLLLCDQIDEE